MNHQNDIIMTLLLKEDKDDEATEAAVPEDVRKRAGKVVDILTAE